MKLLIDTTSLALWHTIVHDAETSCNIMLERELEAYLVFLLMRYVNKPELVQQVIAPQFLAANDSRHAAGRVVMQEVGDKCLLLAGLFPAIAEKRLVKLSYFVNLGQAAYLATSKKSSDLHDLLAHQFVALMDILQSIRHPDTNTHAYLPLQAYEVWQETGSQRAFAILNNYTHATPLKLINRH
jgi:hypothetical protein